MYISIKNPNRFLLILLICILLLFSLLYSFGQVKYEYYESGINARTGISWNNWEAQSFTIGTTGTNESFTLTNIEIQGYRTGSPGTATIELFAVSGNLPTGSALSSGSFNGNTLLDYYPGAWINVNMSAYTLNASTKYIFVIKAASGDASNYLNITFKLNNNPYTGGMWVYTSNSGGAWTEVTASDLNFQVWGTTGTGKTSSKYYIHPDSTYKNISDIQLLLSDNDTILLWEEGTFRTSGISITKDNIVIDKYPKATSSKPKLTGYFDISGSFTQNGNVYTKTISTATTSEKNAVTYSHAWTTYYWGFVNTLNFLLIDGQKHTIGKYPDDGYISVTDTANYYSNFTCSSLGGLFPNNHWNGAYANMKTVDWIVQKMPIDYSYSTGMFQLRLTPNFWSGTEHLKWHNYQGRRIKLQIINHPNTLSKGHEWSYNFSSKSMSVYSVDNLNTKTIEFSPHDSVMAITGATGVKIKNIEFSGANRYTLCVNGSGVTVDSCLFVYCSQAIAATGSNLNVTNSEFRDITGGGITSNGLTNELLEINNNQFKRIGIWDNMGNGEISSTSFYAAIRSTESNSKYGLSVTDNVFDSCGFAFISNVVIVASKRVNGSFERNLVTNSGGWNLTDIGPVYLFNTTGFKIARNGVFKHVFNQPFSMNSFEDVIGLYLDGDTDTCRVDSNIVSHYAYNIKLHGTNNNFIRYNKAANSVYQELYMTEYGWGPTHNTTITYNTFAPKSNSNHGVYYNRAGTTVNVYGNDINYNSYLNWNNADDGIWYVSNAPWSGWTERNLPWLVTNYGWEASGYSNNTAYDTSIIFYNWTPLADTVYFSGTAYNETGETVSNYIIVPSYYGRIVRFNSFNFVITNDYHTTMEGVVIKNVTGASTPCNLPTNLSVNTSKGYYDTYSASWNKENAIYSQFRLKKTSSPTWLMSSPTPYNNTVSIMDRGFTYEWSVRNICNTDTTTWVNGSNFMTRHNRYLKLAVKSGYYHFPKDSVSVTTPLFINNQTFFGGEMIYSETNDYLYKVRGSLYPGDNKIYFNIYSINNGQLTLVKDTLFSLNNYLVNSITAKGDYVYVGVYAASTSDKNIYSFRINENSLTYIDSYRIPNALGYYDISIDPTHDILYANTQTGLISVAMNNGVFGSWIDINQNYPATFGDFISKEITGANILYYANDNKIYVFETDITTPGILTKTQEITTYSGLYTICTNDNYIIGFMNDYIDLYQIGAYGILTLQHRYESIGTYYGGYGCAVNDDNLLFIGRSGNLIEIFEIRNNELVKINQISANYLTNVPMTTDGEYIYVSYYSSSNLRTYKKTGNIINRVKKIKFE